MPGHFLSGRHDELADLDIRALGDDRNALYLIGPLDGFRLRNDERPRGSRPLIGPDRNGGQAVVFSSSFFSSPLLYISVMMSEPPTNSPLT